MKTRGKVPWEPEVQIEVTVRPKATYYRRDCSPRAKELLKGIEPELIQNKKNPVSDPMDTGWEHFLSLTKSSSLYENALLGDIQSAAELSKIVAAKFTRNQKLYGAEEEYFQKAIQAIADGELANVAFLTTRKNGMKDRSHIPDRDRWIYEEFCKQLDSGKKFSEAANSINLIMTEFHHRAESELLEAKASGIVQRVEEAERLIRLNTPIGPERLGDIFDEQGIKHRRELIDLYLESRALRKNTKEE